MISLDSRPRLAPKTRVRFDRKSGRTLLLFPEKGLELNGTAAEVVRLCTGERPVAAIVDELAANHPAASRADIERQVVDFLGALVDRCLVRFER